MPRVVVPALAIEFEEGGDTLWVQGLGGTLLRIKTSGKITSEDCPTSPFSHGDVAINQNINICLGFEQRYADEYFDAVNEPVKKMLERRGIEPVENS